MSVQAGGDRQIRFRARWSIGIRYTALSTEDRAAAWALATWMDPDGGGCKASIAELAHAIGKSRATAGRCLERLDKAGLIVRIGGGGRGRLTLYRPALPEHLAARVELVLQGLKPSHSGETLPGLNRLTRSDKPSHPSEQQPSHSGETQAYPYQSRPAASSSAAAAPDDEQSFRPLLQELRDRLASHPDEEATA